ncbi:MAG: hypothetical protein ACKO96_20500, partial [Flammeovirgaceae bacterium]
SAQVSFEASFLSQSSRQELYVVRVKAVHLRDLDSSSVNEISLRGRAEEENSTKGGAFFFISL